jgi:diguanylate cyclase (GGDEF)-like protein/PAS domain S-box-containing protein
MPSKSGKSTLLRYRSLDDPETLRTLVKNLGEGIYITSANGEILDANDAFLRILGFHSLDDLRQLRAEELYADPKRRQRWQEQLARDGAIRDMELELRRADGRIVTVLDTSYACRDEATGEIVYHGILVDIDARKDLERQLFEASIRDPLTGAYNRRYLQDVEKEMNRRPTEQWACIYIDLDNFKNYNDTHGHAAGDAALVAVSRFLMRQLRTHDSVVRLGGDEFVAVLRGVDELQLRQVVKRLQEGAAQAATVAFTLGWAQRKDKEPFARTIERADERMLSVRSGERATVRRRREDRR